MEEKTEPKFPYTSEGYLQAREWLKEIGEWDKVSTTGFSTDGLSIVHTANAIWEKRQSN